ncbi:MAG: helix-turn-helix domain-containing protein [Sulfuricurvum sp.]|uniref:helix-turn-helix domain-containing protein n=1 Tax=Sulfuricurvum sp. TaxID=2025608 RepID=UPI002607740D|nr:helix-turn-helix domain-containing protein [Sulfuricurvum sp.]MDD2830149.1 helix-turn-helix domain-containing protein [Sulfuricurvum sp.]MDD4950351.1 helix-turn-helix domain-containing protein [Sulfuricurvum sp.]
MGLKSTLPSLIFGNNEAVYHSDSKIYSHQIAKVVPSLQQFSALGNPKNFESKTFFLKLNQLRLIASVATPVFVDTTDFKEINLMIPFVGDNDTLLDAKVYHWQQNGYAILMPNIARSGTSSTRSLLTVDLNPQIIFQTAVSMLGFQNVTMNDLRLYEPRLIPLTYGDISFDLMVRKLCHYIDFVRTTPDMLENLRIDEQFYRLIVMMLIPHKFFTNLTPQTITHYDGRSIVQTLMDYVHETDYQFRTIGDLERFTGLSTRSLQIAFQKQLGITPTQWLRKQNFLNAKRMFETGQGVSVTQVAIECGYTNFSLFAKYYKELFDELPSQTLKNIRRN